MFLKWINVYCRHIRKERQIRRVLLSDFSVDLIDLSYTSHGSFLDLTGEF